jgi:hypothetical protein
MARWGAYQPGRNYNVIIDGHGTGDAPPAREAYSSFIGKMMISEPGSPEPLASLPPFLDLSTSPFFPPIGNQGSQGSCAAWNIGYSVNGYLQRKDKNWTNGTNNSQLMSPSWIYNKNNYGVDGGTNREYNVELVATVGDATLASMPYNQADWMSWGGADAWRTAPGNRLESVYDITDPWNTNLIKYWLAQGDVLSISFDANILNSGMGSDMVVSSREYNHAGSNHAVTIVGYDDFKTADNDAGAFKIANSWGKGWGSIGGYFWMTYDALAEIPDRDILRLHDRVDYEPTLLAVMNQSVAGSRDCSVEIGTDSGKYQSFRPFWNGHQRISGTIPGFPSFMAFDISDLGEDLGLAGYWLYIGSGRSANANISLFGIEWYPDGYANNRTILQLNSTQTPMVAPVTLNIAVMEDVHTGISSPQNDSWQRGTVPISGNAAAAINRTVFSEDFESWSPSGNWNVKDVYKTGRDYNGWAVTTNRADDGERSLWSAGSDDMRLYIEDFGQGWPPSGWAVASAGPNSYPFARSNSLFRGCGPYDYLAVANSSRGAGTNITERLYMTLGVNASSHQNLSLEFYLDYDYNSLDEYAEVQYSTNGTYPVFTQLQRYTSDTWGYKRLDLSFLDGADAVYIGFVYHGTDDFYMAVDDVMIAGNKTRYDPDMNAYVERSFGNISALDGAKLDYGYWMDTEQDADILQAYYRTSSPPGPMRFLANMTGRGRSWNHSALDLPDNATVAGFLFKSNSSLSYDGAYLDAMCLTGYTELDDITRKVDNGPWIFANSSSNWSFGWDSTAFAEGEHTVTVRANYSGAFASSHFHVNVDNTPPNITDWGNGPMTTGDVARMFINGTDQRGIGKVELLYSVNGIPQSTMAVPRNGNESWALDLTVPFNASTLSYRFRVEDAIGNGIETATKDVKVTDNDPPSLGNDTTPDLATTGDPLVFHLTASDNIAIQNTTLEYWYGQGMTTTITVPGAIFDRTITVKDTLEKLHYSFTAMDTSGNMANGVVRTINVSDNDMPSLTDLTPEAATTGDPFEFSCGATDNLDLSSVTVRYWFGNKTPTVEELEGNGTFRLETTIPDTLDALTYILTATDGSGNVKIASPRNVSVRDNDPPVLQNDSSPATAITGGDYMFNITAKDNIGIAGIEIHYAFGSGEIKTLLAINGIIRISIPQDSLDQLAYSIRITDASGNIFNSEERTVPVLDGMAPVFGDDLSDRSPTTGDAFNFSVEARDNIGLVNLEVRYWFEGVEPVILPLTGAFPSACNIAVPSNAANKLHYLFIAADAAGNQNRTGETILTVRDNDRPVISDDLTPREAALGPGTFKVTAKDNMAVQSVTAYLWSDAGRELSFALSAQGWQWSGTYVFLSDSMYYYRFTAQDPSGNIAETPASGIRVGKPGPASPDVTPPAVTIIYPAMQVELLAGTTELTARWMASDNESGLAGCEIELDRGPRMAAGMDMARLITGLGGGMHTLKVHASDRAGNIGTAVAVFSIGEPIGDRTPPHIRISSPRTGQVQNDKKVKAAWTGSDDGSGLSGYFVKLDDLPWVFVGAATSYELNITANGKHTLTVRALDLSGNVNEDTVNFSSGPKPAQGTNVMLTAGILTFILVLAAIGVAAYSRRGKRSTPRSECAAETSIHDDQSQ